MNMFSLLSRVSPSKSRRIFACLIVILLVQSDLHAAPQLPDFTYQGFLSQNGAPANGSFNLTFALFDAVSGGSQVGATINEPGFPVVDGVFTNSLSFPGAFTGTQMWLQVSVNGLPLLPRQAVSTTPVAQFALSGTIGGAAGGDLFGSYPNPTIASLAVTNSKLGSNSVTASKIAAGAVGSSELATSAVGTTAIADNAVTTAKIATDSVTRSKLAGGANSGNIGVNLNAGQCGDANISVSGAQVGDMAFLNMQAAATLPQYILIMPLKVATAGIVLTRFCNLSDSAVSVVSQGVLVQTMR